jgi:hypothetical protein
MFGPGALSRERDERKASASARSAHLEEEKKDPSVRILLETTFTLYYNLKYTGNRGVPSYTGILVCKPRIQ